MEDVLIHKEKRDNLKREQSEKRNQLFTFKQAAKLLKDKNFIQFYQDFNLRYLKNMVVERKTEMKEAKKVFSEFHVMTD